MEEGDGMRSLGYYNGEIGVLEEMRIPMNDRACWFGEGVCDAHLCRNYNIYALDEHIDRFYNSAALIDIRMPMKKESLKKLLMELVRNLDTGDLFVYYQVTRGTADREHTYPDVPANLWVTIRPTELDYEIGPIKLITMEDTRFYHCNIKTLNLLPSVLAAEKAKKEGCEEAVFYRPGGRITECSHSNIHIIKHQTLITAPADNLILPGITRSHLINLCLKNGIAVSEVPYTLDELYSADEVIVTSSSNIFRVVGEIDGMPVGGKAPELISFLAHKMIDEFIQSTDRKSDIYRSGYGYD